MTDVWVGFVLAMEISILVCFGLVMIENVVSESIHELKYMMSAFIDMLFHPPPFQYIHVPTALFESPGVSSLLH